MNAGKKMLGVLLLAASVAGAQTSTSQTTPPHKPKTDEQIRLEQMTDRMEQMERDMQEMKRQLQQAKDAAAAAQAAADLAAKRQRTRTRMQQQARRAVTALQTSVAQQQASTSTAIQKVQADQKQAKSDFEHPDILHYKGITLSPNGSYLAGETGKPESRHGWRHCDARGLRFRSLQRTSRRPASFLVPAGNRASLCWPRASDTTSPSVATTKRTSSVRVQPPITTRGNSYVLRQAPGVGAVGVAEWMVLRRWTDVGRWRRNIVVASRCALK